MKEKSVLIEEKSMTEGSVEYNILLRNSMEYNRQGSMVYGVCQYMLTGNMNNYILQKAFSGRCKIC